MYEDSDKSNDAFRQAEKQYKLHQENIMKTSSKGYRRGGKLRVLPVDLSQVIYPGKETENQFHVQLSNCVSAYGFKKHKGLYIIPDALSLQHQIQLLQKVFTEYCEPPAATNHTAVHGKFPYLWQAAQQQLELKTPAQVQKEQQDGLEKWWCKMGEGRGVLAASLLEKLRWSCLGPYFNWSERRYCSDQIYKPLPQQIKEIAQQVVQQVQGSCIEYNPNVALVNFYHRADTLGGHVDDAETEMDDPIVSLSLGCSAIFLVGGQDRNTQPSAFMLNSGDIVIMCEEARRSYHGVPRILTPWKPQCEVDNISQEEQPFVEFMKDCRVNISIRKTVV